MGFLVFSLIITIVSWRVDCSSVSDQTGAVGLSSIEGFFAGYGDFNSDQATDIFTISHDWSTVNVYLWNVRSQAFTKGGATVKSENIVGIAPSDFDGDGDMDLLVSTLSSTKTIISQVYFGNRETLTKSDDLKVEMKDQPTIFDKNGDFLPDLFGTGLSGNRTYWVFMPGEKRNSGHFTEDPQETESEIVVPNSNGFIDATGDLHPDLVVKSKALADERIMFEVWIQNKNEMELSEALLFPDIKAELIGQASFADIDNDGIIDLVVPVCLKKDCEDSIIYSHGLSRKNGMTLKSFKWHKLWTNSKSRWKFDPQMFTDTKIPLRVNFGDFIMDGRIDAVSILVQRKNPDIRVALQFVNQPCIDKEICDGPRTFRVVEIETKGNPISISLMDVYENGALDFMVSYTRQTTKTLISGVQVLKNDYNVEAAFLKVAVLSGDKKSAKYGSNLPGAIVEIQTTDTDGNNLVRKATQLSQSSYFALQLPYVVFGLGKSPNFVEKINVGVGRSDNPKVDRVRSWTSIIPNSQVIVIPRPKDSPSDWVTRLLVTPSKLLLQTAGVLVGTCLLLAGLILILYVKDKKEDEREKRKEAHKFHFDAL